MACEMKQPSISIQETLVFAPARQRGASGPVEVPSLGIAWHPDRTRIGETTPLLFGSGEQVALSRLEPLFHKGRNESGWPLGDPHISRTPTLIKQLGPTEFEFSPPNSAMHVSLNGRALRETTVVSLAELGREIVISIADSVILVLHMAPLERPAMEKRHDIVGISAPIQALLDLVGNASASDVPVLIRGETGVGKELVAQALHRLSPRRDQRLVAVNMATLPEELAAAELFGVAKGAFTGAATDRPGLFEQARGSTLFMDEIGNTPATVQPMLLRTLETQEIRRVGDSRTRLSDARIIAATDRNLEDDDFSEPLLRRLEGTVITVPPLRDRRVDIGLLVRHFLETATGSEVIDDDASLPADWMVRLVLHAWPGNVRELKNLVQQITLGQIPRLFTEATPAHTPETTASKQTYRPQSSVSEQEMLTALDATGWRIKEAANQLQVSRTALYDLMHRSSHVREIDDIPDQEILAEIGAAPPDFDALACRFRVGREALKRKVGKLRRI